MQVVRTGPDIEKDQRPEVDDRQFVAEHGAFCLLRDEVIHHPQEARCQEEAHGVVTIPPLHHRILHTGKDLYGFRTKDRDRDAEVVEHVQHGHGDNEGQEEPVRHIDMRLFALNDRSQEHSQIGQPDDGQPQVDIPLRFSVFLGLRAAKNVARRGQHDEQVVPPEHEPREIAAPQARGTCALYDVERCRDQRVTAKRKNHRRGVQRPQATEVHITLRPIEIQHRKGQLKRNERAGQKADNPPEGRCNHTVADHLVHVAGFKDSRRHRFISIAKRPEEKPSRYRHDDDGVNLVGQIARIPSGDHRKERDQTERDQLDIVQHNSSLRLTRAIRAAARAFFLDWGLNAELGQT